MSEQWTVKTILDWIEGYLTQHGDEHPRLSAQWLVADALSCTRLDLYTDLGRPLTSQERDVLRKYTKRRAAGEPLQYITGTTDFRFLTLEVSPGVLIPRPETEVLVSAALDALDACEEDILVVDLGTGSGNIACALASELPNAYVFATDISPKACTLAVHNVEALGLQERVVVLESDLGSAFPQDKYGMVDLVISNPPYIPRAVLATLDAEVADFEPVLALDGGPDGLDVYRRVLSFAQQALRTGGVLAVELHETCLEQARELASAVGFRNIAVVEDLAKKPRVIISYK